MKTQFRLRRLVIVLAVAALAGTAALRAEIIERVLVKINGEIVTQTDLETRQSQAIRSRKENPATMSNAELNKALAEVTPGVLVDAVDEILLLQRGKELGYKLTDDKFKQILDNIKKENKIESEDQFQAALKSEGLTMADLRKQLEKSMIVQQVQGTEVLGKISITEAEAKAYFDAHRNEFLTPATMMLREILVAVPLSKTGTFSAGQDEAAKAKADSLQSRAKAGDNFEKLVAEGSEAPSKANGGLIGPISMPDLDPALRAVFEPLKEGDITRAIRTSGGYQIFKVDKLTPAQEQPWEQAREEIGQRVAQSKQAAEFGKYMAKLRAQAVIEWKNAELRRMFDDQVAKEEVPTAPTAAKAAPKKDEKK
jgi:peptidyl-prolyl cis-trans isomerase SurA